MEKSPEEAAKKSKEKTRVYKSIDYSGFFERLFARLADLIIAAAFGYLIFRLEGLVTAVIAAVIFDLVVRIITTYFWGFTIGKFLFGTRVISRCSKKLSLIQVIVRELFRSISAVFACLGYITVIFHRRKRAWHDMAACTAVTSGGKSEAEYARDIYVEKPQRWYRIPWITITGVLAAALLAAIVAGARYMLYDKGMIGFPMIAAFAAPELSYKVSSMAPDYDKSIIQIGDINGDKKYEVFREGLDNSGVFIRNVRLTSVQPVDGNIILRFDKAIIQYRLLDMNDDEKDELAVLMEDKTLKIYSVDGEITEIGSLGPLEYNDITQVIKGKPDNSVPWRLYILGDKNKLTVVSMNAGALETQKFELAVSGSLVSLGMGSFSGKNYLVGSSEGGNLIFYSYDGNRYRSVKSLGIPMKGKVSLFICDSNMDDENEIFMWSDMNDERPYPVIAAYEVSGNSLKPVWDGGRFFDYEGKDYVLKIDEALDIDKDGKLEVYTVPKKISGQEGSYSIFVFCSDEIWLKANDFLRTLSLSPIR